jgi:hypothetical protein
LTDAVSAAFSVFRGLTFACFSEFAWTDSLELVDDGTCNYTCSNFDDFGSQNNLTQCMLYDHNPWVWNLASSGLLTVDSSRVFFLQGPSNIAEYEGRVRARATCRYLIPGERS